jgi:hypothetical protein
MEKGQRTPEMLDKYHIIRGIVYRRYHGSSSTAAATETTSPTIAPLSRPEQEERARSRRQEGQEVDRLARQVEGRGDQQDVQESQRPLQGRVQGARA